MWFLLNYCLISDHLDITDFLLIFYIRFIAFFWFFRLKFVFFSFIKDENSRKFVVTYHLKIIVIAVFHKCMSILYYYVFFYSAHFDRQKIFIFTLHLIWNYFYDLFEKNSRKFCIFSNILGDFFLAFLNISSIFFRFCYTTEIGFL